MRDVVAAIEAEYRRYKALAEGAFTQLTDEQLCRGGGDTANAIAVIVWHVSGNLASRFTDFLTADGEKPWRNRDEEFVARQVGREEFLAKWQAGWTVLQGTLATLSDADLGRTIIIRGQPMSVLEALQRSLAHVCYHVGQIVYVAKALRGDGWTYLSIAPGASAAYNANPTREKPPHAAESAARGPLQADAAARAVATDVINVTER